MNINFSFDPSVSNAPPGFTNVFNQVASFFANTFADPVTLNIAVGYGEIGGQPLASGTVGESSFSIGSYSYSQIKSALVADSKSSVDASAVASLPASNPTGGNYWVSTAEAKALGLSNGSGLDGSIGFAADNFDFDNSNGVSPGQLDFFGVVAHEVSEIMGRFLVVGQNGYAPMDLFHFSSPGVRTFSPGGYFSADNGATNLGTFNTNGSGDRGDWSSSVGPDSFLAFVQSGVVLPVSANDIKVLDALGWDISSAPPVDTTPPTLASTSPLDNSTNVAVGSNVVLTFSEAVKAGSGNVVLHKSSDGSAVASIAIGDASQVSFSGSTVTVKPTSDLAWGTHYYVTIDTGAIQDLAGNAFAGISSNSAFDFTTTSATPIETAGATTLATSANHYYLLDNTGAGPSLKYSGADVVAGQFAGWTPIGAEKTATGYEIAWKMGSNGYTLWLTDNNGNYTSSPLGTNPVPGSNSSLESAESLFQQDLNGDGVIGVPTGPPGVMTPIETAGATTLATSANHYYLLDNTGAGPSLKYSGADVVAGQFAGWAPIGAEKTATGYEIAWKMGSDGYTLWLTDNNGNYTSSPLGTNPVPGSNSSLESAEPLFQQDLNGDGVIGVPTGPPGVMTPIETAGATTLATSANHYYLLDNTGAGPSLKYSGADVVAGQFAGWAPIGAEKTATGYEIAWKMGSDGYTLWLTDNNGNYTSSPLGTDPVPGSNSSLEAAEPLFQQDLNGDGVIGVPGGMTPIETAGATTLATSANHYYLLDNTGAGLSLKYSGADVVAGQFGGWAPIGAEKTATGYEIAWKIGSDGYTLWLTDNNGNYTSSPLGTDPVPGSNSSLEAAEPLFQQDLNGDGHIGVVGTMVDFRGNALFQRSAGNDSTGVGTTDTDTRTVAIELFRQFIAGDFHGALGGAGDTQITHQNPQQPDALFATSR